MPLRAWLQMPCQATIGRFVARQRRHSAIACSQPPSSLEGKAASATAEGDPDASLPARESSHNTIPEYFAAAAAFGRHVNESTSPIHMQTPDHPAKPCSPWRLERGLFGFTAHGAQEAFWQRQAARAGASGLALQRSSAHKVANQVGTVGSRELQRPREEAAESSAVRCERPGWRQVTRLTNLFSGPAVSGRSVLAEQHVRHAHQAAGGSPDRPSAMSNPAEDTLDWDGDGGGGGLPQPQPADAAGHPAQERQERQPWQGPVRSGLQGRSHAPGGGNPWGVAGGQRQAGGPQRGARPPLPPQARLRSPGALVYCSCHVGHAVMSIVLACAEMRRE